MVSDHIFLSLCYHIGYTHIQSHHIVHVYVVLGDPFRVVLSHSQPTSSVRELEASVSKLYAIVNSQAAALSDKNTINPH